MYLVAGIDYTIVMDGVPGPVGDYLKITVYPDPVLLSIRDDDQTQTAGNVKTIRIDVRASSHCIPLTKAIFLPSLASGLLHRKCCSHV